MDLFGPTRTMFISGKIYDVAIIDNYTRWSVEILKPWDKFSKSSVNSLKTFKNEKFLLFFFIKVIMVWKWKSFRLSQKLWY